MESHINIHNNIMEPFNNITREIYIKQKFNGLHQKYVDIRMIWRTLVSH